MADIGVEVTQKIRLAIKAKLTEIGVYVDEELPDYVMVMVVNKRSKEQMDEDLELFLGSHTSLFTTWLHQVLQKLQQVTVANLAGVKRKVSEETKKKRKTRTDKEKKGSKKKIKHELEDDKCDLPTSTKVLFSKEKIDSHKSDSDDCGKSTSEKNQNQTVAELKGKDSSGLKSPEEELKKRKTSSSHKQHEESSKPAEELEEKIMTPKSQHVEAEDFDDEDCINIRTDGELLDTVDEANVEELQKVSADTNSSEALKIKVVDQENIEHPKSVQASKEKQSDSKEHKSPSPSPSPKTEKVTDARELLNRKKAAKQNADSESRNRKRSAERSLSPISNKRSVGIRDSNNKNYRENRDHIKRSGHDSSRESYSHRDSRDSDRDRKSERGRDSYLRREDRERKTDYNRKDRNETAVKRRDIDDWSSSRPTKIAKISENRKIDKDVDFVAKRRGSEDSRRRGGVSSQVVTQSPEPEEDVETPVSSVVQITPRPRRPPSQQPSTNLIMKAISDANRSLANVLPRPDSTQKPRRKPVLPRTLRTLQEIRPAKFAISINNTLAMQNVGEARYNNNEDPEPPKDYESADKKSHNYEMAEVMSSETPDGDMQDNPVVEEYEIKEEQNTVLKDESPESQEEPILELTPPLKLEPDDEPMEDVSDPQFVVTLNGYDPDGIFSQNEGDLCEDTERGDWLKVTGNQHPVLTSTPDSSGFPQLNKEDISSLTKQPAVNHSNLIPVDIIKSKAERCKFWPACRLADKCTFYHPTKACIMFPACKFGDSCMYIHPQCKYNAMCTRKDCMFSHTPVHTPSQPQAVTKTKALYAANAPLPCKFYPNCTNINCQFAHPIRACRYGPYCAKKDCSFDHGQIAPVEKLKWTRVPTTTI